MPPNVGKGAVWVAFVRPFVCPSVAYIANNSRIQRPSGPKFRRKVPHLRCDSHTSFKVKRSKVRVASPINADKHRASYLLNAKAYELQTWYTNGGQRPASATGAMTSKVKDQGRKVTWSVWAVLSQCYTCVIRGRRGHIVSAEPGGHTFQDNMLHLVQRGGEWARPQTAQAPPRCTKYNGPPINCQCTNHHRIAE